jgi:hypothetical protein
LTRAIAPASERGRAGVAAGSEPLDFAVSVSGSRVTIDGVAIVTG